MVGEDGGVHTNHDFVCAPVCVCECVWVFECVLVCVSVCLLVCIPHWCVLRLYSTYSVQYSE